MRRHFVASSLACLVACGTPVPTAPAPEASLVTPDVTTAPDVQAAPDVAAAADVATRPDTASLPDVSRGLAPLPASAIKVTGFARPDAAVYVAPGDYFLVSNINGKPFARDDNGFISKVKSDGTIVALKWVDGASPDVELNSPKGMVEKDGVLYVADIDHVRRFSLATGAPQGSVKCADEDVRFSDVGFIAEALLASDAGYDDDGAENELGGVYGYTSDASALERVGGPEHPNRFAHRYHNRVSSGSRLLFSDSGDAGLETNAGGLEGAGLVAHARLWKVTLVASRDLGALLEISEHEPFGLAALDAPPSSPKIRTLIDGLAGPGDFAFGRNDILAIPLSDADTLVITPFERTEIPMPADWNELQQVISRALEGGRPMAALVDEKWGVYLDVRASMVGPLEMDRAAGDKPIKFPKGAWISHATTVRGSDLVGYGIGDALDTINVKSDLGEAPCDMASLTCASSHHNSTAHHLQFARNAKGELKLIGVLSTDAPGPSDEELSAIRARFDKALARTKTK